MLGPSQAPFDRDAACDWERDEAAAWAQVVQAAAIHAPELGATALRRRDGALCSVFSGLDFPSLNRVLALGLNQVVSESDLEEICDYFHERGGTQFRVEMAPFARAGALLAGAHVLRPAPGRMAKLMRPGGRGLAEMPAHDVEILGIQHGVDFAELNRRAWGLPNAWTPWYQAAWLAEDLRRYGVFEEDQLVATGLMSTRAEYAWMGFDAVAPSHQGRGLQRAMMVRRIHDAADLGCAVVHAETRAETPGMPNVSLRNLIRLGFSYVYDRTYFEPAEPCA